MGLFAKSSKSAGHVSIASRDGISRGNHSRGTSSHGGATSTRGSRSIAGGSTRGSRSYKRMAVDAQMEKCPLLLQHTSQHSRNPKFVQNLSNVNIDLLTSKITSNREHSRRRERTGDRSRRESKSTTPSGNRSRRESRSTIPRMIKTAIVASPTAQESRSRSAEPSFRKKRSTIPIDLDTDMPAARSRSVEPMTISTRKCRSIDLSSSQTDCENKRSRSAEPAISRGDHKKVSHVRTSRSVSPSGLKSRSSDTSQTSLTSSGQSRFSDRRDDATLNTRTVEAVPYRLGKDMTYVADGMNLDKNTRCLLAAYDAKTIDDFYLMSDNDFAFLVQRANANNHSLPPLQIRKVRMLRRWLKEVVEDNISENDDTDPTSLRKQHFRLIPKDWKDQYKNDLPHLKLQLRQQGDSLFERIKVMSDVFSCGTGSIY